MFIFKKVPESSDLAAIQVKYYYVLPLKLLTHMYMDAHSMKISNNSFYQYHNYCDNFFNAPITGWESNQFSYFSEIIFETFYCFIEVYS